MHARVACALIPMAVACSKQAPIIDVSQVAADAKADSVGAVVKYRTQLVRLRGVVAQKSHVAPKGHLVLRGPGLGAPGLIEDRDESAARLVLTSAINQPGHVRCYFLESELESLARVEKGVAVDVHCIFKGFTETAEPVGVFAECVLAE